MPKLIKRLVVISPFKPNHCNRSYFVDSLYGAIEQLDKDIKIIRIALSSCESNIKYDIPVWYEINQKSFESFTNVIPIVNIFDPDIIVLHFEFNELTNIENFLIVDLLRTIQKPIITVFHNMPSAEDASQKSLFNSITELSQRVILSFSTTQELVKGLQTGNFDLIAPGVSFTTRPQEKQSSRTYNLLTHGNISPKTGVETVVHALPKIVKDYPSVSYTITGTNSPEYSTNEIKQYREKVIKLSENLGVDKNLIWYDHPLDDLQLKELIRYSSISIFPFLRDSITSLSFLQSYENYSVIIATPFAQAIEMLSHNRGRIVPFNNASKLGDTVIDLLKNDTEGETIRKAIRESSDKYAWSRVAEQYLVSFSKTISTSLENPIQHSKSNIKNEKLPDINLAHLMNLTDSTGILQHAKYTLPDFNEGYCTDDNARGLILGVQLEELGYLSPDVIRLQNTCLCFTNYALDKGSGKFRNFMSYGREWIEKQGSEDSQGRSVWALGVAIGRSNQDSINKLATDLFPHATSSLQTIVSARSQAFALVGIHESLKKIPLDQKMKVTVDHLTHALIERFHSISQPQWVWFERIVTYGNAKIPQALILWGKTLGNDEFLRIGLDSLKWLIKIQSANDLHFQPIGNEGFYPRDGAKASFDQQPLESYEMVTACISAWRVTGDKFWLDKARMIFSWFLGTNDVGVPIYDSNTGGCHDALHSDRVNENEGAESTLAFLLALTEIITVYGIEQ